MNPERLHVRAYVPSILVNWPSRVSYSPSPIEERVLNHTTALFSRSPVFAWLYGLEENTNLFFKYIVETFFLKTTYLFLGTVCNFPLSVVFLLTSTAL